MRRTSIAILGSTGSIGVNTLDIVADHSSCFNVVGLTAGRNLKVLNNQISKFKPVYVSVRDKRNIKKIRSNGSRVLFGDSGLLKISSIKNIDIIINALVGAVGLKPTLTALENKTDVAIANKETLVMAGELVTRTARKHRVRLYPIDSEHNAISQCLNGEKKKNIRKIILTASGGPFRNKPLSNLKNVKPSDALKHPNWSMGKKITIDSATMMNKGFEVMEAVWLFGVPLEKIEILIHPQSIIHSMVEFVDGSILAQMGVPDMRIPIQYALFRKNRLPNRGGFLNLLDVKRLDFKPVKLSKYPCLGLALDALKTGGTAPAALNAANEVAVNAFLHKKIGFLDIPGIIEKVLENHYLVPSPTLEEILDTDTIARREAERLC